MVYLQKENCWLFKSAEKNEKSILRKRILDWEFKSCWICWNIEDCTKHLVWKILTFEENSSNSNKKDW